MTSKQAAIGSAFGARTAASEVISGLDLRDKLAIVTGGWSGLGLETTRAFVAAGMHVVVGARRVTQAREALMGLDRVEVQELDLSRLESVHRFAADFVSSARHADIVVANAGVMACPEIKVGPGWELQFATNHLGHYVLVNELWPALVEGTRVVVVSSAGHHLSPIRWHDPHFETGYDKWQAYGQSKTANVLFALHLDSLGNREGIRAFSVHPGKILTPLQRHLTKDEMVAARWIDGRGNLADPTFKTTQQGAATQVWAATSPQLQGMGGLYCEDCEVAGVSTPPSSVGVRNYATDADGAARLWRYSAQVTGVDQISGSAKVREERAAI